MSSTTSTTPFTTLIVGNGIGGPIMAMALQKTTKHNIILIDSGPEECLALGGGIGISANGLHALKFIDAEHIVLDRGAKHEYFRFRRGDTGAMMVDQPTADIFTAKFEYPNHGIIRQTYCEGLRDLARERGIDMRFNMRLKKIEEHDDKVTVHFADGQSLTVDLLIGCDGIHSHTRAYVVGEETEPDFTSTSVVIGVSNITKEEGDAIDLGRGFNIILGDKATMGTFPGDAHGNWAWFLGFPSPNPAASETAWGEDHSTEKLIELVRSKTASWKTPIPELLMKKASRAVPIGLYDRKPLQTNWHRGRVVLVGDAAHPTTPAGGQGSQMAAESAVILARLLADHEPSDELFKRYAALRHHRTDAVTGASRKIIGGMLAGWFLQALRNVAITWFGGIVLRGGVFGHYAYDAATAPLEL